MALPNTLTCTPTGGTGPYTYLWSVNTAVVNGPIVLNGKTIVAPSLSAFNTQSVQLGEPPNNSVAIGTVQCKVTDAAGKITYAYYHFNAIVPV